MWYRRVLALVLFPAAVVLPLWLVLARGIFGGGSGWDLLAYLLIAVLLGASLAVVAALIAWRSSVRRTRAVSTLDAVVVTAWYLVIILHGAVADDTTADVLAAIGVLLAIAAFWSSVVQLVRDTRERMSEVIRSFEQQARPPGPGRFSGPVIRIDPPDDDRR